MGADYDWVCPQCYENAYEPIDFKTCPRCKGKGYELVVIGEDNVDKDICNECDGEKQVPCWYECGICGKEFEKPILVPIHDDESEV